MSVFSPLPIADETNRYSRDCNLYTNFDTEMCKECVRTPFPDRDRMCLEKGAFMANLGKCMSCGKMDLRQEACNEQEEEEVDDWEEEREDVEMVTYRHLCGNCGHTVSLHKYQFWVEEGRQEYRMDCLLCGFAEDSVSCMPNDPRKASAMEL